MKIEHIFNEVKKENNNFKKYITPQEFTVEYVKNLILDKDKKKKNKKYLKELKSKTIDSEFDKKYYYALYPAKNSSIISKYDDEKIDELLEKLGDKLLLISGDFWGIQSFIFDSLTSKNASKIMRSRSAMVQLLTFIVAQIIKEEFKKSDVVLFGAGKFLILAKYEDNFQQKIEEIQKELDKFFLENFFGQNGVILSYVETSKQNIMHQNSEKMKEELIRLGKMNELKKLNKFNLKEVCDDDICIDIFKDVDKNNEDKLSEDKICHFCKKRVGICSIDDEAVCEICRSQVELGKFLATKKYVKIFSANIKKHDDDIFILNYKNRKYYAKFFNDKKSNDEESIIFDISNDNYDGQTPKWSLNAFVAKDENGKIKTFEELAENSSGLFALKADVDRLGNTFREFYMTSFKKFNRLSRELDFFFSDYVSYLIEHDDKYKNIYVIFAGGDDLFLIGEYKEVVELAKQIRQEFYKFSLQKATLSMGLVMFKPSTPINYVSELADEAEHRAKNAVSKDSKETRNGIDIFGISMKFDEFLDIEEKFAKITDELEKLSTETTSFYYRLITICEMRENIEKDIRNALWKSKLTYFFRRNILDKVKKGNNDEEKLSELLSNINDLIDEYGEKVKPSIFLKIYKNRDDEKE